MTLCFFLFSPQSFVLSHHKQKEESFCTLLSLNLLCLSLHFELFRFLETCFHKTKLKIFFKVVQLLVNVLDVFFPPQLQSSLDRCGMIIDVSLFAP